MAKRTLHFYYARFATQTYRLLQVVCAPAITPSCELPHVYSALFSAVRLQFLWGEFCKRIIIESALGNVSTASGRTLSTRKKRQDIELDVKRVRWHLREEPSKIAFKWRIENYDQVTSGLALAYAPIDEVNRFRNYLVHPGKNSRGKLVSFHRISLNFDPYGFLSEIIPGGISRFENWVDVMRVAAYESVK